MWLWQRKDMRTLTKRSLCERMREGRSLGAYPPLFHVQSHSGRGWENRELADSEAHTRSGEMCVDAGQGPLPSLLAVLS